MDKNPLNKGVLTENFVGIGPVTRAMVHARERTGPDCEPAHAAGIAA